MQLSNKGIINPIAEIAAYETLWAAKNASFKSIAKLFSETPGLKPTDLIQEDSYRANLERIKETIKTLRQVKNYRPNLIINGSLNYPSKLRDAKEPVELLYYTGILDLIYSRSIAIVGTRKPTPDGIKRTEKIARLLVNSGFTIVSGLAAGVDTAAHQAALRHGGRTIAVIGTPLSTVYPKENAKLQDFIAQNHLLISQVPFLRYQDQDYRLNRLFFPERNKTMSAITDATIIVEAGETSGTLIQARAALHQGRKLFILNSCFENKSLTWPAYYEKKGAIRVKSISDVLENLNIDVNS